MEITARQALLQRILAMGNEIDREQYEQIKQLVAEAFVGRQAAKLRGKFAGKQPGFMPDAPGADRKAARKTLSILKTFQDKMDSFRDEFREDMQALNLDQDPKAKALFDDITNLSQRFRDANLAIVQGKQWPSEAPASEPEPTPSTPAEPDTRAVNEPTPEDELRPLQPKSTDDSESAWEGTHQSSWTGDGPIDLAVSTDDAEEEEKPDFPFRQDLVRGVRYQPAEEEEEEEGGLDLSALLKKYMPQNKGQQRDSTGFGNRLSEEKLKRLPEIITQQLQTVKNTKTGTNK